MPTPDSFPLRYLPYQLSRKDRKKQCAAIKKSRKAYRSEKGAQKYIPRPILSSFKSK